MVRRSYSSAIGGLEERGAVDEGQGPRAPRPGRPSATTYGVSSLVRGGEGVVDRRHQHPRRDHLGEPSPRARRRGRPTSAPPPGHEQREHPADPPEVAVGVDRRPAGAGAAGPAAAPARTRRAARRGRRGRGRSWSPGPSGHVAVDLRTTAAPSTPVRSGPTLRLHGSTAPTAAGLPRSTAPAGRTTSAGGS